MFHSWLCVHEYVQAQVGPPVPVNCVSQGQECVESSISQVIRLIHKLSRDTHNYLR